MRKYLYFIIAFIALPLVGFASYPPDARTCASELIGASSYTCEIDDSEVFTILSIKMMQSGTASSTDLKCGTSTIAKNYAKDYEQTFLNYVCTSSISFSKTGNDNSFLQVVYVPYDLQNYGLSETIVDNAIVYGVLFVIYFVIFISVIWFMRKML